MDDWTSEPERTGTRIDRPHARSVSGATIRPESVRSAPSELFRMTGSPLHHWLWRATMFPLALCATGAATASPDRPAAQRQLRREPTTALLQPRTTLDHQAVPGAVRLDCFDPVDSTGCLQAALNSKAPHIVASTPFDQAVGQRSVSHRNPVVLML